MPADRVELVHRGSFRGSTVTARSVGPRPRWARLFFLPVTAALITLFSCSGDEETLTSTESDTTDPAYQLAVIDGTGFTDADVEPYALTLEALDTKCAEDARRVGDYTVSARDQIADAGVEAPSLLEIMRSVNETVPTGTVGADCLSAFSLWILGEIP